MRDAPPDATTDALVSTLREVLADMRQDRDHWRDVATQLALTDQRPRSCWRRLEGERDKLLADVVEPPSLLSQRLSHCPAVPLRLGHSPHASFEIGELIS